MVIANCWRKTGKALLHILAVLGLVAVAWGIGSLYAASVVGARALGG